MNRNEMREIHHSIGEIERHLADIHSTLASNPEFKEITRLSKKALRKKSRRPSPDHATSHEAPDAKGGRRKARKREWKDEDPWEPGRRFKDSRRKPPYVLINLPAKEHRKVNRERLPVPVGEQWVHAGCNVFVRRDVYRCFTRVRDALSKQMNASFEGNWND